MYRRGWELLAANCKSYWWTNLLFINNIHPWQMADNCIGWVWYLANDFQFFLLSPPLIYVYCKHRKIGYSLIGMLILTAMLVNGVTTALYDVGPTIASQEVNAMDLLYVKPWARMGAYFVGALFGLAYFEMSKSEKHPELRGTVANKVFTQLRTSRLTSVIVFVVGVGLTALYVFPLGSFYQKCGLNNDQTSNNCWGVFPSVLYNSTSRPFFVLGLGLVLLPTFVGRFRIVKNLLSSEIFAVLARLNYMVYMIHCLVLFWFINDLRQASYVNSLNQWFFSISTTVVSFIFAVPFTLLCEVPFMNIEKYVLFPVKSRPKRTVINDSDKEVAVNNMKVKKYYALSEDDEILDSKQELIG